MFARPIEAVIQDGKTIVVDGHHRLSAIAEWPGFTGTIPVNFRDDITDLLDVFGTFGQ